MSSTTPDPDEQRAASREMWEKAAAGWDHNADRIRDWGMPVSATMLDGLALGPGQRVLELAAGPGDTGFMAAELIRPGGSLISSDGTEAMVEVARRRAADQRVEDVEFAVLDLEWIDLPTASVDAILCRWGIMLIVDPDAAAREMRRVLRPGGRAALAVWDIPAHNPWATIPSRVLIELGHAEPPDPDADADAPGMFRLAPEGRLANLLQDAGFVEVSVEPVALERRYQRVDEYIRDTREMSPMFGATFNELTEAQQAEVLDRLRAAAAPFQDGEGLVLPGKSLVAVASA